MKNFALALSTLVLFGSSAVTCQETASSAAEKNAAPAKKGFSKILVVYYSRTGNTKRVAEDIAKGLNADMEEIVDTKKRSGLFGFIIAGKDATQKKPADIKEMQKNPAGYDIVIIGTPVWAWTITPAVRAYAMKYGSSIKQAAFFCTAGKTTAGEIVGKLEEILGREVYASVGFTEKELKSKDSTPYWKKLADFLLLFR